MAQVPNFQVCPGGGVFEPHWSNFWQPPGSAKSKDFIQGERGLGHYATLDINITHPIRTTQLAISRWLNPPEGSRVGKVSTNNPKRVVHISSIAGQTPGFATPLYGKLSQERGNDHAASSHQPFLSPGSRECSTGIDKPSRCCRCLGFRMTHADVQQ